MNIMIGNGLTGSVSNEEIVEKIDDNTYKVKIKLTKDMIENWLKDEIMKMDLKPFINFNTMLKTIEIRFNLDQNLPYDGNIENKKYFL